jgi:hypothetical protein
MTPDEPKAAEMKSRRDAILADALREADRRRHRRALRRAGAVVCTCALLAGMAVVILRQNDNDAGRQIAVQSTTRTTAKSTKAPGSLIVHRQPPKIVIQIIRTEDVKPTWQTISDDQLLATMADVGKPSGIVNVNGKTQLIPIRRGPS